MRCPRCSYQSPFDVVRCPRCEASFGSEALEELGHLAYLRTWIANRRDQGLLPAGFAKDLIDAVERRQSVIESVLGLGITAAPGAEVVLAPVVAAPPARIEPAVPPAPAATPTAPIQAAPALTASTPPSFSWADVGTYLLSERTLHALLGLGALLILASGVVISTLNPTGLGPLLHLAAVLGTTVLFYASGYVVRQRLRLTLTGAALLGIGGAFIPLTVWTLGQELLHWEPGAIWLVASLLCLPVYIASHALLRDRTFAVLVGVAGGSELLALLNWMGVSLEWGLALLVGLATAYIWLSSRLHPGWRMLSWALSLAAQIAVPLVLVLLLGARFFPAAWEVAIRKPLGELYEYAIGLAWWLGAAFFAYAAQQRHPSYLRVLAIWTLPVAYLLTLTKAPWEASWHNVALAVLAGLYILYARQQVVQLPVGYRSTAREPVLQAAFALTILAAVWPAASADTRIATLLVLAVIYSGAAAVLHQRAWAHIGVYLLPISFGLLLDRVQTDSSLQPLLWAGLAGTLLCAAEIEVRRTGEGHKPLVPTVLGHGNWTSLFGSPLFSAGYLIALLSLWLAGIRYWNAPAVTGVRELDGPTIFGFLLLVTIAVLSTVARQTNLFLHIASWLFLIPFTAVAERLFTALGLPLPEAELARVLALLGSVYLALGFLIQHLGERYARPMYLVGYVLSLATMLLSALDRALNVQVIGLSVFIYVCSAWLVHTGRHRSYAALLGRLFGSENGATTRHASALFIYLAVWLLPAWMLLAMSLRWPPPAVADYGMALTLLAPVYAAIGLRARAVRAEYRWPWYLAAYALSAIGPLVATADVNERLAALAISIGLYAASAIVSKQSAWLYPVALLTPVLTWQAMDRAAVPASFDGLALVVLALVYGGLGVVLHHGVKDPRGWAKPIRSAIGRYARAFFQVAYVLCALGLALVASQDKSLVVAAFGLAATLFAASAVVFRQPLFGYPLVPTAAVAYVVAMTLTGIDWRYYGLGLLPGLFAVMAVAELLRRRLDLTAAVLTPRPVVIERWATPYYVLTYLGSLAVPIWSTAGQGIWAVAWWFVVLIYTISVVLFHRPAWLYPAVGTALVAYLATLYALVDGLAVTDALAALVVPGLVLFSGAFTITYRQPPPAWPSLEQLGSGVRLVHPRWADPLVVCGWASVALAVLGAAPDPSAGLRAGAIAAVLLVLLATFWQGRVEAWASLAVGAVAVEDALRLLGTPILDQPPYWAVAALFLSLVAIGLRRHGWSMLQIWPNPLSVAALASGAGAVLWAVILQMTFAERQALQSLSATIALSGLTVLTYGWDRRQRLLVYQGVGLLLVGYMLQLLFFDVGQPQAFVLPAGGYLLLVAYLEWRRGTDARVKGVLELASLALLLVVSLLQAVGFLGDGVDRHLYATFLLLESVVIFGLGAVLHWRRSFIAGMLALVLCVAILLADPLRALNTWYLAAVIGLAMIVVVVFIEQRRKQIPFWLDEWHHRLEAWQ